MYESVLQGALGLPQELKEELVDALKAAILEDACTARNGKPDRCPRCGHDRQLRPPAAPSLLAAREMSPRRPAGRAVRSSDSPNP